MPAFSNNSRRYRIAKLVDGRLLAFDDQMRRTLLLMPKTANGSYRLARSGSLGVRGGVVTAVQQPANCTGYRIEQIAPGKIRLSRPSEPGWQLTIGSPGVDRHRFAILDLQGGNCLLANSDGVQELQVVPAADGVYGQAGGRSITVRGGAPAASTGDPDYDYPDDFAP